MAASNIAITETTIAPVTAMPASNKAIGTIAIGIINGDEKRANIINQIVLTSPFDRCLVEVLGLGFSDALME